MSRIIAADLRRFALASITLATITACQNDGPIEPGKLPVSPNANGPVAIKIKPTLYFNGILFSGTHEAPKSEIYAMNPDGSSVVRLTTDDVNNDVTDAYPDVSPTGPAFIWSRFSPNGQISEIYSQNLDGSKRKRLTFLNNVALHPRYSPDGSRIAFTGSVPGAGPEIFAMNADGTGVTRLTFTANVSSQPSWSPDGSKIAFKSGGNNGVGAVWVMDANGGNQKQVAACAPPGCQHPKWNPVTNEIAVERIDGSGIFVIDATTGAQTGYIPGSVIDMMPTWSKDGLRIIFSSMRSQNATFDLFSTVPMRRTDTMPPPVVRLTTFLGNEMGAAYSR